MPNKPAKYCSRCRAVHKDECPNKPKAWIKKKGQKSGRGGRPWERKRKRIFERDMYQCQLCPAIVDLHGERHGICDHIINQAQGGSDEEDNLQTLCQRCSNAKTHQESMHSRGGDGG